MTKPDLLADAVNCLKLHIAWIDSVRSNTGTTLDRFAHSQDVELAAREIIKIYEAVK